MEGIEQIKQHLSFCLIIFILSCHPVKVGSSNLSENNPSALHNVLDVTVPPHVLRLQAHSNPANSQDMKNLNTKDELQNRLSWNSKNDVTPARADARLVRLLRNIPNITPSIISESLPSTPLSSLATSRIENWRSVTTFATTNAGPNDLIKRNDSEEERVLISQQELRTKIIENLPIVCPTGRVCRQTSLKDPSPGFAHCCAECSCEKDCNVGNKTCCFESEDPKNQPRFFEEECNFLTTAFIDYSIRHSFVSYNMISSCPSTNITKVQSSIPCGEEDAAPWGSLFPVYSASLGKIFKNNACALCNGINDAIEWHVEMVCRTYSTNGSMAFQLQSVGNFESFLNGFNPDGLCYVNFRPPVAFSAFDHLRCVQDPISVCPAQDFSVPDDVSMSKSEIVQACSSGLKSYDTMLGSFRNVFCHICNSKKWYENRVCYSLHTYPRDSIVRFSTILSKNFLLETYRERRLNKEFISACMATKVNKKICRKIFCPDGQTYDGKGKCILPASRWNIDEYEIIVKLVPETTIPKKYIDDNMIKEIQGFDTSKLISPFPDVWILQTLSFRTKNTEPEFVDHFISNVRTSRLPKDPSFVLEAVKRFMKRKWFLLTNETRVSLKAEFSGMRQLYIYNHSVCPMFFRSLDNHSGNKYGFGWNLIRDYVALSPKQTLLTLTKLFFCNQIALQKGEYVLEYSRYLLRYNNTNYLDGDFSAVMDTDTGEYVPRICIEDSGFIRQNINGMDVRKPKQSSIIEYAVLVCCALKVISE